MTLSWPVVRPVEEAVAKVLCPVTIRGPETVKAEVEALVTNRLLVEELKVKLVLVAMDGMIS